MLKMLTYVDKGLAKMLRLTLGLKIPKSIDPINGSFPADANPKDYQPLMVKSSLVKPSAASVWEHTVKDTIATRKVAFLLADGVNETSVSLMKKMLEAKGAVVELVATKLGTVMAENKVELAIPKSLLTTDSVLYDASVCAWREEKA